ncbi:hypothetical protein ACWF9B_01050 [Streptomyces sp. NPDC055089]
MGRPDRRSPTRWGWEPRQSGESGETRALRLARGAQTSLRRNVASQRLDKARDRAEEAWCVEHADRIREVAERVYDTSGAWDLQDLKYAGTRTELHGIGELLATDGSRARLADRLPSVRYDLAPWRRSSTSSTAG